jgi:chorismate mutase/prephenate dehydratase
VFFVDIQGHREDPEVAAALDTLRSEAGMYKELGSYPNAVL